MNLYRKFAGWCQNDGTQFGGLKVFLRRVIQQVLIHAKQESRRFSGAGLGLRGDVFAFEHQWH